MSQDQSSLTRNKNISRDRNVRSSAEFEDPETKHVTDQISDVGQKVYTHAKVIAEQLANKVIEESQIPPEEPGVVRERNLPSVEAPNIVVYELKASLPQERDFPLTEAPKPQVSSQEKVESRVDTGIENLKEMGEKLQKDSQIKAESAQEKKSPSLEEKHGGIINKVSDLVFKTEEKIEEKLGDVKNKVSDAYEKTKDALGNLKDRTLNLFKRKDRRDVIIIPPGQKIEEDTIEDQKMRETENFINKFKLEVPGESVFEPEKPLEQYIEEADKSKSKFILEETLKAYKSKDNETFTEEKIKIKETDEDEKDIKASDKAKLMQEAFEQIMFGDD